jgi:UDP-glucose 4-epimerase
MKILVTGAAGFIGFHLRAELETRGHEVIPFDRPQTVMDRAAVFTAAWSADAVINLAGQLGTAEIIGSEKEAAEVNIIGALNVYDAAATAGIPVVQIGTGHKGQPNPYAITKGCAEDLGLSRARWLGEKITVVRAYHVYGPHQKPPPPHGPSTVRKIIPSFACRALTGMDLEVWGDGTQRIDLVHASSVASVLADAISGPYGTVIEAGTGKPLTVLQAARDVISAAWSQSRIVHLPMRPGEPEGALVAASAPACADEWPYLLDETVAWYRLGLAAHAC